MARFAPTPGKAEPVSADPGRAPVSPFLPDSTSNRDCSSRSVPCPRCGGGGRYAHRSGSKSCVHPRRAMLTVQHASVTHYGGYGVLENQLYLAIVLQKNGV